MLQIKNNDKLYVIIRKDLAPGAKIAQSCHATFSFSQDHPEVTKQWINNSNYIVVLEIENEEKLSDLLNRAQKLNIITSQFREPDLNNSITAIVLSPGDLSKQLCKKLRLAFFKINEE